MDLAKMKKKAAALLGKASRGDWLMVRKNISVRDEYYRKSAPDKTLWHDDMEVEFSLCIALVIAVVAVIGAAAAVKGMFCRMGRRKKR
ncbi:MAG: hypothetical protein IKR53_04370 [Clostridia bacterium]|nr:hypothetical protein [Clostridia bacterium]MBR6290659.1 hypothetical protein [Clostridia bacterium]